MKNKEKVWKYNYDDNNDLKEIIKKFSIYPKAASLLKNRGILNEKDIIKFLFGGLWHLHNPFLFEDMQKAVIRIRKAIDAKERILVYGDRDVDGISAVNIIVYTLKKAGANVWWYVPADEGCKIHKDILTQYAEENVKLLITVDCGIAANEEIEYAKTLGMDIIITDHHEPLHEGVPKSALAIINPKLEGTKYPFKNIAGCAVALKTAQAFTYTYNKEYGKTILLFSYDKDEIGDFVLLCNDLIIEKGKYKRFDELKELIKKSFRIYTFDNNAIQTILKKDILLKDKIIFCQIDNKDISSLILEKEKISCNDSSMKEFFDNNMDLCALGTIADAMPLIDENRIIVKEGLKILAQNPHRRQGLGLLIEDTLKAKHSYNITANSLSWNVTPVLNSAGRMGRGMLSAQLLMTKDSFQAQNLYNDIIKLNGERRILQLENIGQFKYLLKEQYSPETDKIIIVAASNLEHGVTGIAASQIVKEYGKPVFLLISDGREAIGAVRSVEGFNIIEALESLSDILIKYGGHNQAAGFTIEHSKIEEFKERMLEYADKNIAEFENQHNIMIEGQLKISDINADFYKQIEAFEPFGMANPKPIFCMKGVTATEAYMFGSKNEHLKFKLSQNGSRNIQSVFWNKAKMLDLLRNGEFLDIAFHLDMTEKNAEQIMQLSIIDIKLSY